MSGGILVLMAPTRRARCAELEAPIEVFGHGIMSAIGLNARAAFAAPLEQIDYVSAGTHDFEALGSRGSP
jgi:hypothetical protein